MFASMQCKFLSWRIFTVALGVLLLRLPWVKATTGFRGTNSLIGNERMASTKSPGEIHPKTLELNVGASANITCRLTNEPSSTIWFEAKVMGSNISWTIQQPSEDIMILDSYSAMLSIRNDTAVRIEYICKSGAINSIDLAQVYFGYPPLKVVGFKCRAYDYKKMLCSFPRPQNTVDTNYTLTYVAGNKQSYKCDDSSIPVFNYTHWVCELLSYLPSRENYIFTLNATNTLGTIIEKFYINNFLNVVPAKLKINLDNITSDSVTIHWRISNYDYYKKYDLEYEIWLKPEGSKDDKVVDYIPQCRRGQTFSCWIIIKNLAYPYRKYQLRIHSKVKTAENVTDLWSTWTEEIFETKSRRPDIAPETAAGSFTITTEKKVRLYWRELAEYEQNGPDFHYLITATTENGVVIHTNSTNQSSITLPWQHNQVIIYRIQAANKDGLSLKSNHITVYPQRNAPMTLYSPREIVTKYDHQTYRVSWNHPADQHGLSNYTFYWCVPEMESLNQCKGTINFTYVSKDVKVANRSDAQYQNQIFAVAANYDNFSTGMHWARCSAHARSDLIKMKPKNHSTTARSIVIQWSSETVCTSILEGYNLTYCEYCEASKPNSTYRNCTSIALGKLDKNYTISNLVPYTEYGIKMFMHSAEKQGLPSDELCVRTADSVPYAPKNLQVDLSSVTSNSVNISWEPPDVTNGRLLYYSVWKNKTDGDPEGVQVSAAEDQPIFQYTLTSLNSYSEYNIDVSAHTSAGGNHSNSVRFRTNIRNPTSPRNVTKVDDGKYGEFNWEKPEVPSGRLEFYVVSLIMKYKDNRTSQKITLTNSTNCRIELPQCESSDFSYHLKVRAVNVAAQTEVDVNNPVKRHSSNDDTKDLVFDNSFHCLNTSADVGKSYMELYQNYLNDSDNIGSQLLPSEWVNDNSYSSCRVESSGSDFALIGIYVGFILLVVAAISGRKKYYEMQNINIVLPAGLIDPTPHFKVEPVAGVGCDKNSETTRSFEWYLYSQKEDHHLLASTPTEQKGLPSLSVIMQSTPENNNSEGSIKEPHFLESISDAQESEETTEEIHDDSISSSSYTTMAAANLKRNDYIAADGFLQGLNISPVAEVAPTSTANADGYVDASAIVVKAGGADISNTKNATVSLQQQRQLPTTNNGYVQADAVLLQQFQREEEHQEQLQNHQQSHTAPPQHQQQQEQQQQHEYQYQQPSQIQHQLPAFPPPSPPPASQNIDGYTTLEALDKPLTIDSLRVQAEQFTSDYLDADELVSDINPHISHNHSNINNPEIVNQNPKIINGYVTQKQLAEFGQFLH